MQRVRKHSRKRDAILDCLRTTRCHPSADWIFGQLKPQIPDLSLGTVYRNLAMFKQEGTIISVGVVDGLERFDYNVTPHSHLVCCRCGSVVDVDDLEFPRELLQLAEEETGGRVEGWNLQFTGLCQACKEKESQEKNQL